MFSGDAGGSMGDQFAYLFRRFGYPVWGSDSHKSLVTYMLTTPDTDVILWCKPSHWLRHSFGFGLSPRLDRESMELCMAYRTVNPREQRADWEATDCYKRIDRAVGAAMAELLRPVFVRDVPFNILGRVSDDDLIMRLKPAEHSPQAGYGLGRYDPVAAAQ
jgi:hypothetical protein